MSEPTAAEQWNAVASNPQTLLDERNALRDALLDIRKRISGRRLPFCDDIREVIKLALPLLLCVLLSGCVQPIDPAQPVKPDERKPVAGSMSDIVYRSLQDRDLVRAKKLTQLADDIAAGRVKYDNAIMKRIEQIGADASRETWVPVSQKLARTLDGDPDKPLDQAAAVKAVRELATGSERAGGK